jgi:FkbM family methyltransferase
MTLEGLLTSLRKKGLKLETIFDVGAHQGLWSKNVSNYVSQKAKFYLFEPNQDHTLSIEKTGYKYFNYLLGKIDDEEVPFFANSSTGDSVYREVGSAYKSVLPKLNTTRSLDSVIRENRLPNPDFLKLDTQGSDLDILKGATRALEETKLVVIELPLVVYNLNAPLIGEILEFMDLFDFTPIRLTGVHIRHHVFIQIDIAFLHNKEFKQIFNSQNIWRREK